MSISEAQATGMLVQGYLLQEKYAQFKYLILEREYYLQRES